FSPVHPAIPLGPDDLLADDEPLDDRSGCGHSKAHAETGGSAEAFEPHGAEGGGAGSGQRREAVPRDGGEGEFGRRTASCQAKARRKDAAMSEQQTVTVEATGETVGEAKWAALRELEALVPGLDRESVQFQVVSEGERGLLGVGFAPARVIASAD